MTSLSPFGLTATAAARSTDSFSTGPDGLHTEQLLVHRKMLNINSLPRRHSVSIWPMVKYRTTISETT
jgi:hypothetical protein